MKRLAKARFYQYLISEQSLEVQINTKKGPVSRENEDSKEVIAMCQLILL